MPHEGGSRQRGTVAKIFELCGAATVVRALNSDCLRISRRCSDSDTSEESMPTHASNVKTHRTNMQYDKISTHALHLYV